MHARQDQPAEMPMQWLPQLHWENILKSESNRKVKKEKALENIKPKWSFVLILLCKEKRSTMAKIQIVTI